MKIKFNWMIWHKHIGLATCVGIILWTLSGISHPIMTHLQPVPAAFTAPVKPLNISPNFNIKAILSAQHIDHFEKLAFISLNNKTFLRVTEQSISPARYFDVIDGKELIKGDIQYANMLASHFTGRATSDIINTELVTTFSNDYHEVNRLLPVWRVDFKDAGRLHAFIDVDQSRLSTLSNDTRDTLTRIFRFGHNWSFIDGVPKIQLIIMALALSATLFSGISGLYLYFRLRNKAKQRLAQAPIKRWHRRLGLAVALSTLMFAGSGLFHLIMSYQQARESFPTPILSIQTKDLPVLATQLLAKNIKQAVKINLVNNDGKLFWFVQENMIKAEVAALVSESHDHSHKEHRHSAPVGPKLISVNDAHIKLDLRGLATKRAANYAKLPETDIVSSSLITHFSNEYGFIFKRLPVVKVQFKGETNPRYFVEPATGALAVKVENIDGIEGFVFALIHKWNFNGLNKDLRDILVSLFALGNLIVAILGFSMFLKKI